MVGKIRRRGSKGLRKKKKRGRPVRGKGKELAATRVEGGAGPYRRKDSFLEEVKEGKGKRNLLCGHQSESMGAERSVGVEKKGRVNQESLPEKVIAILGDRSHGKAVYYKKESPGEKATGSGPGEPSKKEN